MRTDEAILHENLKAKIASLRAALKECAEFKITDSNGFEVEEDSLHEIRKIARRAIEQTAEEKP